MVLCFTTIQNCLCAGILSLLLVVVVVLTTTVLVLRPNKAKLVTQWKTKPKWRSLGEPFCPAECVCSRERCVCVDSIAEVVFSVSTHGGCLVANSLSVFLPSQQKIHRNVKSLFFHIMTHKLTMSW